MSEIGPSLKAETEILSNPDKLLARIQELRDQAQKKFDSAQRKLTSGAFLLVGASALAAGAMRTLTTDGDFALYMGQGVGSAVLGMASLYSGAKGFEEWGDSKAGKKRADSLENALTTHLLNKYNAKQ